MRIVVPLGTALSPAIRCLSRTLVLTKYFVIPSASKTPTRNLEIPGLRQRRILE
jgi:hypothetical protein